MHQILGSGIKHEKLYYLNLHGDPSLQGQVNSIVKNISNKERVILWHCHLGYLSFRYLKQVKPNLFLNIKDFDLKCNICELAKGHRISYVPSYNKNSVPFMTIHSDV